MSTLPVVKLEDIIDYTKLNAALCDLLTQVEQRNPDAWIKLHKTAQHLGRIYPKIKYRCKNVKQSSRKFINAYVTPFRARIPSLPLNGESVFATSEYIAKLARKQKNEQESSSAYLINSGTECVSLMENRHAIKVYSVGPLGIGLGIIQGLTSKHGDTNIILRDHCTAEDMVERLNIFNKVPFAARQTVIGRTRNGELVTEQKRKILRQNGDAQHQQRSARKTKFLLRHFGLTSLQTYGFLPQGQANESCLVCNAQNGRIFLLIDTSVENDLRNIGLGSNAQLNILDAIPYAVKRSEVETIPSLREGIKQLSTNMRQFHNRHFEASFPAEKRSFSGRTSTSRRISSMS